MFVVRMVDTNLIIYICQVNTHDQIDDLFSNKTWNIMDRNEELASRWTTDHTSVFFHLTFFIFMMVSIDSHTFYLFPSFLSLTTIESIGGRDGFRIVFLSLTIGGRATKKNVELTRPISFPSSHFLFFWIIFLLGTSSSLHHFSLYDVSCQSIDRFDIHSHSMQLEIDANKYIYCVVKWWTSALASTMPVPSGTFIPVFKVTEYERT